MLNQYGALLQDNRAVLQDNRSVHQQQNVLQDNRHVSVEQKIVQLLQGTLQTAEAEAVEVADPQRKAPFLKT